MNKRYDFLKAKFPNSNIHFIDEGWDSFAFSVDDNIVRFSKKDESGYDFEKKILDYIRDKIPFQIPNIQVINDTEYSYSIHQCIHGSKWNKTDVMDNWPDEKRDNLIRDFVDFLVALHSIDTNAIMTAIPELQYFSSVPYPQDVLWNILKNYITDEQFDGLYKKYTGMCKNSAISTPSLLHMDFGPLNSLVDESGRICGVIDFNGARIGQPDMDLMRIGNKGAFFDLVRALYESKMGRKIDIARGYNDIAIEYVHAIVKLVNSHNTPEMKNKNIQTYVQRFSKYL